MPKNVWLSNAYIDDPAWLSDYVIGDPMPSDVCSVEELKALGLVGIYYAPKPKTNDLGNEASNVEEANGEREGIHVEAKAVEEIGPNEGT